MDILKTVEGKYKDEPLGALIQLVPGVGGAVDSYISLKLNQMREERLRVFFDALSKGKEHLTKEVIESNDFLHCYFSTLPAVLRSRRKEKITLFSRLLLSAAENTDFASSDKYEIYNSILDDLSFYEIQILSIFDRHFTDLIKDKTYSVDVEIKALEESVKLTYETLGIDECMLKASLLRIERTGCYGSRAVLSPKNNLMLNSILSVFQGKLTDVYYDLKKYVKNEEGNFC